MLNHGSALRVVQADAILGAQRSGLSAIIASRSSGKAQLAPIASWDSLSNAALYPGFGRVHPSNFQSFRASIGLLRDAFGWAWTAISLVFVDDVQGRSLLQSFNSALASLDSGLHVAVSTSFDPQEPASARAAMAALQREPTTVVLVISPPDHLPSLLEAAEQAVPEEPGAELLSPRRAWVLFTPPDEVRSSTVRAHAGRSTR